jgi:hypothetical protein
MHSEYTLNIKNKLYTVILIRTVFKNIQGRATPRKVLTYIVPVSPQNILMTKKKDYSEKI